MGDRHMVGNDVVTNNGILRLVINLDRSPERMRSISQQLVARDLHFERLPAVDGRKLAQEELSRLEAPYDAPEKFVFRKALWPNEIACFLSHTACWKKLVKSGCEWGVIMEDDIVLSPRFKLFATSSEWIPEGVRVIQLHGSHQSFAAGESYPVRDTELCRILCTANRLPTQSGIDAAECEKARSSTGFFNYSKAFLSSSSLFMLYRTEKYSFRKRSPSEKRRRRF